MKKMVSVILIMVVLGIIHCPVFAAASELVSIDDFLLTFNYCAALSHYGHELSTDNTEISRFSNHVLLKAVYNGCEILSLNLNPDSTKVMSVKCTYSMSVPGSSKYSDDFLCLLTETLSACGMNTNSIADVYSNLGLNSQTSIGDSGDVTVSGIRVSYEVTKTYGLSIEIKRA